jgi:O-antigen biosynthesis protein
VDGNFEIERRPSPKRTARFVGYADPVDSAVITGWAVNPNAPSVGACLTARIDGIAVDTIKCSLRRADLAEMGLDNSHGGFEFPLPPEFHDGKSHVLALLFEDGTPVSFPGKKGDTRGDLKFRVDRSPEYDSNVDGVVGSGIRGWALRKDNLNGKLEGDLTIQVVCDGTPIQEITASVPRLDVSQAKGCDPRVGFDFQIPPELRTGKAFTLHFRVMPDGVELRNSPVTTSFPANDAISRLYELQAIVDDLCAKAWTVQRQIKHMLPSGYHSVADYDRWAKLNMADLGIRVRNMPRLEGELPLVSVILPAYKPVLKDFVAAVDSIRAQTYTNWELIIVDDSSRSRTLSRCLASYAAKDSRIKVRRHRRNQGISAATNTALGLATGSYIALADHDDLLVDVALELMVREALRTGAKLLYSDEDKVDEMGVFSEPHFKPDWNYRLLLGMNYVCHLLMIEAELLRKVGHLDSGCDGAQDHDLLLRLSEKAAPKDIHHVPEVLYHWRKTEASTASSGAAKPYAVRAGKRAVQSHLLRRGFNDAEVSPIGERTMYTHRWGLLEEPSVAIIIPFKDQATVTRRCLECVLGNTDYGNYRVILVDNWSQSRETELFCEDAETHENVTVRRIELKFNYSLLNNVAARENPADFYVFLNNDVFLHQRDWLRVLMDEALADPTVGIVGAKLIYPNQTVQHAGIVLGVGGIADHAFRGIGKDDPGYVGRAWCAQEYSAVTAACMLCRAETFKSVDGFDERELAVAYNDVDMCLKARQKGWRVVWTPTLVAEHHESLSRGDDMAPAKQARFFFENQVMARRWGGVIRDDPFYNRHFSRNDGIFNDLKDPEQGVAQP